MTALLLVEDNETLGAILAERLATEGYVVSWAQSVRDAQEILARTELDVALIDIGLPDGDGFEVARSLGGERGIPVLFLTAVNSAEARLSGFELGAADYIPKPFHLKELLLRLQRVMEQRAHVVGKIAVTDRFQLEPQAFTVVLPEGGRIVLPPREFSLFEILSVQSPRVLSREEIIDAVSDSNDATSARITNVRSVDNLVTRLRQLLPNEIANRIRSVRGVGYQFLNKAADEQA